MLLGRFRILPKTLSALGLLALVGLVSGGLAIQTLRSADARYGEIVRADAPGSGRSGMGAG